MPLKKDIANEAGVSLATVSRVFNNSGYVGEEKRAAVLNAAKLLGVHVPERAKKPYEKMNNDIIGVVVTDINNPFFSEAIKGILRVLRENQMNALICDTDEDPEQEITSLYTLRREKVGGIIITPTSEAVEYNAEYLKELDEMGIHIVLLDRDIKTTELDGIFLDSYKGALEATKTFIDNGHKEIAIIAGAISSKPGIDRLNGYLEALRMNNMQINEHHILHGDFKKEKAYNLTIKLLETRKEVTAIFSSNNLMSAGCFEAILDLGLKVPDDIALISFDDFYFFKSRSINISVVSRPTMKMGIEAANIIVSKMKQGKNPRKAQPSRIIFSPNLILRGSEVFPINKRK